MRAGAAFAFLFVLAVVFYSFNVFSIGVFGVAILTFTLVIFGSAVGTFVSGLIYRFGQRIQVFAWSTVFLLQPFSAVFYPRDTLPGIFHTIALAIPTSYVFEGMRTSLSENTVPLGSFTTALGLTLIYLIAGYAFFAYFLEQARQNGYLAQNS
ncbi:MAG: ABC transporter permease [Halobacteria archaeon]|nr:ABC transporter permease [Halobacteria archaeon]